MDPIVESDLLSIVIIAFTTIGLWVWLQIREDDRFYRLVLFLSYVCRVAVLWWDRYGGSILVLPNVGGDSDDVHVRALLALASKDNAESVEIYPRIVAWLYRLFGPQRMLVQHFNVLLSIAAIIITVHLLRELEVKEAIIRRLIPIAALFPQGIILSSLLLRESIIVFFLILSLAHYFRWYLGKGSWHAVVATCSLLCAALLHSGVIVVIIVYFLMFVFYDPNSGRFRATPASLLTAVAALLVSLGVVIDKRIASLLLGKFMTRDIYSAVNYSSGGSAYLKGVTVSSFTDVILYAPIKLCYFMLAPMPWDWRGLMDLLTFCIDSSVYLLGAILIVTKIRYVMRDQWLALSLSVIILSLALTYSLGTNNAGTAARHRNKIMLGYLSLAAIVTDRRTDNLPASDSLG